jgi:hypothetical protein
MQQSPGGSDRRALYGHLSKTRFRPLVVQASEGSAVPGPAAVASTHAP